MKQLRANVLQVVREPIHDAQSRQYSDGQEPEDHSIGYPEKLGAALLLFKQEFSKEPPQTFMHLKF